MLLGSKAPFRCDLEICRVGRGASRTQGFDREKSTPTPHHQPWDGTLTRWAHSRSAEFHLFSAPVAIGFGVGGHAVLATLHPFVALTSEDEA